VWCSLSDTDCNRQQAPHARCSRTLHLTEDSVCPRKTLLVLAVRDSDACTYTSQDQRMTCCPVSAEAWWTSLKICSSGRSSSSARLLQRSVICSHCISSPVSRWSACGSCTQNIDSLCRTWNSGRGMSHSSANAQIYVTGQILPVKELWKMASIWRSHWQNYGAYLFGPPCIRCSVHFPVCVSVTGLQQHAECMDKFATVVVVLRWLRDNKNTSCRWGTARRGRASWNLVKYCTSVHDMQFIQWNQRNFTK